MIKLRPLPAREIFRKLRKIGFTMIRQKGSHTFWQHSNGRCTVVPFHKGEDIGKGLLRSILNDTQIEVEDFNNIK